MLLHVRGQQVGLRLTHSSVRLAVVRLCQLLLWRLGHLSEVVVGAAHYPRVGKGYGGSRIVSGEVKVILDQYGARRCLIEGHL